MNPFDRITLLLERVATYAWWEVLVELLSIGIVVYVVLRFVRGTRAAGALKGALVVLIALTLVARIIGAEQSFERLTYLYQTFLTIAAITLVVVFQPELRRAFIRLGETPLFRRGQQGVKGVVDHVVDACTFLSKARFGGLIVIERDIGLRGLVEGGTPIGATVSSALLQTIFHPGTALHDLAVVISNDQIEAAGVQLPLAEPEEMPSRSLGSRHRAAVGLTKECDAVVVVVSEETGRISIAERGRLELGLTPERLREELIRRLDVSLATAAAAAAAAAGGDDDDEKEVDVKGDGGGGGGGDEVVGEGGGGGGRVVGS